MPSDCGYSVAASVDVPVESLEIGVEVEKWFPVTMESNKTNGGEPPSIRLRFKYQVNILLDWVCPFTTNWANKCPMAWTSHSDWCQTLSVKNVPVELQRYQWLLYLNGLLSSWITYLSYFNGWEILVGISVRTYQNTSFSINFANKACFTVVCEWNCAFIYLVCFFFFFTESDHSSGEVL